MDLGHAVELHGQKLPPSLILILSTAPLKKGRQRPITDCSTVARRIFLTPQILFLKQKPYNLSSKKQKDNKYNNEGCPTRTPNVETSKDFFKPNVLGTLIEMHLGSMY